VLRFSLCFVLMHSNRLFECWKTSLNKNINRVSENKRAIFTARSSYACAVLEIVILSVRLSVCPSVTRVLCDKTIEHTADILIPNERETTVVFWYQQRLGSDVPFNLKFALKLTHPSEKRRLQPISAYNVWVVRASEKCSSSRIGKIQRIFQRDICDVHKLPLTSQKGGSKSRFVVFVNKI